MIDPTEFASFFLAGFFSFVAVFYTIRLTTTGKDRQFLGKPGTSHWLGHMAFRVLRVVILAVCILRIPFPALDRYLLVCTFMMKPLVIFSGIGMMLAGFLLTLVGHFSLGKNWASGINPQGPGELVSSGIYRLSRNPMYIGVLVTQFGFFLALPSLFTFLCLVIGHVAVFNQVRLEEAYLSNKFGDNYLTYLRKVPRWLGKPLNH